MQPFKARNKKGPERIIQEAIENMLRCRGWYVMRTHGNMYQSGFPDNYATHRKYGPRWIEVKIPNRKGTVFTPAQLDNFPKMCAFGSPIWVLVGATDLEYKKLFKPFNWFMYLDSMRI